MRSSPPATYGWIALALLFAAAATGTILYKTATNPARHQEKILALPFSTSVSEARSCEQTTPQGRLEFVDRVATTRVTDTASHVLADIGDVRIALASPAGLSDLLHTSVGTGSTVIDSTTPAELDCLSGGGTGSGRVSFYERHEKGVTTCTLSSWLTFSIQKGEIDVSGAKVPVGKGRKVVFLNGNGTLDRVVDLETGSTR